MDIFSNNWKLLLILGSLVLSEIVCAENSALGALLSPRVVIAEKQTFWAGIKLRDGCTMRSKVDLNNPPEHYCDVIWDKFPDGAVISDGNQVIGASSLPEGTHVISGVIHRFASSDPTKPVESTPFRESVKSKKLDVAVKLEGLPLDNFAENRVFLSSPTDNAFSCVFYGGPIVETKVSKIEQGKLWCHVDWVNVPPGFAAKRPSSPAILEGRLTNPLSEDVRDNSFAFKITAVIPYQTNVVITDTAVDASRDALKKPGIKIKEGEVDDAFFLLNDLPPTKLFPVSVGSDNDYPLTLSSKLQHQGNSYSIFDSVVGKNEYVDTMFLSKDFDFNFTDLSYLVVEGGYKDLPTEKTKENIAVIVPASRFFRIGDLSMNMLDGEVTLAGTIKEAHEGIQQRERLFRVYLIGEDDIEGLKRGLVLTTDDLDGKNIVSSNSDFVSTGFNLKTTPKELIPGRYFVVAEQLASRNDDKEIYIVDRILSPPISVHWIDGVNDDTSSGMVNAATGLDRALAAVFISGLDDSCRWNVENEENVLSVVNERDAKSGLNFAFIDTSRNVDSFNCSATKDGDEVVLNAVSINVYEEINVSISSKDEIALGDVFSAEVLINGSIGDLADYRIEWMVNDGYYGEAGTMSLDALEVGDFTIEVSVHDRNNIDVSDNAIFTAKKVIHVKDLEEEEERY